MSLLCVLTASPRTLADVHLLSRRMLAMRASADALLALCDLPDAFAAVMPEDESLLRALQSAVMAADARAGAFCCSFADASGTMRRGCIWAKASQFRPCRRFPPCSIAARHRFPSPPPVFRLRLWRGSFPPCSSVPRMSPVRRTFFLACRPLWMNPVCSPHACASASRSRAAADPPAGFFLFGRAGRAPPPPCPPEPRADFGSRPARFRQGVFPA